MNSKRRLLHSLDLQHVDRPVVACVVTGITHAMMEKTGIPWTEAHGEARRMADLAQATWTLAGIESIKLPFDMAVESEALGAKIDYDGLDRLPTEARPLFNDPHQLSIPIDFLDHGRISQVLQAIGILRKRYDNEVAVISSIVGPFTLAFKLFGPENLFVWMKTKPDELHIALQSLTDLARRYARAQVEAGADAILIGEAASSGSLISPSHYASFAARYHCTLVKEIAHPCILHICGNSTKHLPYLAETGVQGFSFDEGVDIQVARQHLKGRTSLIGYIPTTEILLNGTSQQVYAYAQECLQNQVNILAPGCSLPPKVSFENLAAMVEAGHQFVIPKQT